MDSAKEGRMPLLSFYQYLKIYEGGYGHERTRLQSYYEGLNYPAKLA